MTIPHDEVIQRELLSILAQSPKDRLYCTAVYEQLAQLHPELTEIEKSTRYRNSKSEWANRVQFARLHLVRRGFVFRDGEGPAPSRGWWILSDRGKQHCADNAEIQATAELNRIKSNVAEELSSHQLENEYFEGKRAERLTSFYERNPNLRAQAIIIHGKTCVVCGFNFKSSYGNHGDGYIEVHHLTPVSTLSEETSVNPRSDMAVLCSNCHRMIHRRKNPLSIEDLRAIVKRGGSTRQS